jgi:hypothetical protein
VAGSPYIFGGFTEEHHRLSQRHAVRIRAYNPGTYDLICKQIKKKADGVGLNGVTHHALRRTVMELSDQGEELSATDRSSKNLGTTTKNKEGHYVVRKFHGRTAYLRADSLYAGLSQALSHFPEVAGLVTFPTFLPARPVTAADLAALTERVRRWKSVRPEANGVVELTPPRVPRQARRSCPAAAEAPASLSRGVCAESQAEAGRYGARDREYQQAVRGR